MYKRQEQFPVWPVWKRGAVSPDARTVSASEEAAEGCPYFLRAGQWNIRSPNLPAIPMSERYRFSYPCEIIYSICPYNVQNLCIFFAASGTASFAAEHRKTPGIFPACQGKPQCRSRSHNSGDIHAPQFLIFLFRKNFADNGGSNHRHALIPSLQFKKGGRCLLYTSDAADEL